MIADLAKYMKMVWQCLPIDLVGMCTAFDSVSVRSPPFAPKKKPRRCYRVCVLASKQCAV